MGRREGEGDLAPFDVELLCDELRQSGRHTLTHFRSRNHDRDRSVRVDAEKGVGRPSRVGLGEAWVSGGLPGDTESEPSTGDHTDLHESATGESFHRSSLPPAGVESVASR